jgi:hypothetical protein
MPQEHSFAAKPCQRETICNQASNVAWAFLPASVHEQKGSDATCTYHHCHSDRREESAFRLHQQEKGCPIFVPLFATKVGRQLSNPCHPDPSEGGGTPPQRPSPLQPEAFLQRIRIRVQIQPDPFLHCHSDQREECAFRMQQQEKGCPIFVAFFATKVGRATPNPCHRDPERARAEGSHHKQHHHCGSQGILKKSRIRARLQPCRRSPPRTRLQALSH